MGISAAHLQHLLADGRIICSGTLEGNHIILHLSSEIGYYDNGNAGFNTLNKRVTGKVQIPPKGYWLEPGRQVYCYLQETITSPNYDWEIRLNPIYANYGLNILGYYEIDDYIRIDMQTGRNIQLTPGMPIARAYFDGTDDSVSNIPVGAIIAWNGPAATIPYGFSLCDGSNGTPDLTDRFIAGHTGPKPYVPKPSKNTMVSISQPGSNYYNMIWIMRIK